MDKLSFSNPLFATYVVAATLLVLKMASMSWLTVVRMMKANGGFRSPEDVKKTLFNPKPSPTQTDKIEDVERVRRVHLNDVENIPIFLAVSLLYVLSEPSLGVARILLFGYVVTRILHTIAYLTARTHDTRAMLWTPGSLIMIFMAGRTLFAALGGL
jgi:glutathione S-transferase